jgi:hypothetical protein
MYVPIISTTFVRNISHSKKNWTRYNKKCKVVFKISTLYSCLVLMTLEFFDSFFEKYSNAKLHENLSSGSRVHADRRTDGHDEANSRFRNFANEPKNARTVTC